MSGRTQGKNGGLSERRFSAARFIFTTRRLRQDHFPSDYFGEGEWDILLRLYLAHGDSETVYVKTAISSAMVPYTNGFRAVDRLVSDGAASRTADVKDRRWVILTLTQQALARIEAYLDAYLDELARAKVLTR